MLTRRAWLGGSLASVAAKSTKPPTRPTPADLGEPVAGLYRKDAFPRKLALTFDDGPNEGQTDHILRILDDWGVPATFFIEGRRARANPEPMRAIVGAGHDLGNHTQSHPLLDTLDDEAIVGQLDRCQATVDDILGRPCPIGLVRPPAGEPWIRGSKEDRGRIADVLRSRGELCILWQLTAHDWNSGAGWEPVVERVDAQVRTGKGGVLVWHPASGIARRALPPLLEKLHEYGFTFHTIREMVEMKYGRPIESVVRLPTTRGPGSPVPYRGRGSFRARSRVRHCAPEPWCPYASP